MREERGEIYLGVVGVGQPLSSVELPATWPVIAVTSIYNQEKSISASENKVDTVRHWDTAETFITIFFKPFNFKTIKHLTELSTKYSCRYNDSCHDSFAFSQRYFLVDFSNKMFPYISTFLRLLEKCRKYSSQTKYLSENYKNPQRRSSGKFLFSKFTYKIHSRYLLRQWHWFIDYIYIYLFIYTGYFLINVWVPPNFVTKL